MTETPFAGIIVYATNSVEYLKQAVDLAHSVHEYAADIPIALFTNLEREARPYLGTAFERIISYAPKNNRRGELAFIDKLRVIEHSPYAHSLYLDSDTAVMCDLRDVFKLLQRFQIVFTHGHNRRVRDLSARGRFPDQKGRVRTILSHDVPESFAPIQGGFLLYRADDLAVQAWIQRLIQTYIDTDHYDDQVAMRKTLWQAQELSLYVLPEEYNFTGMSVLRRWKRGGFYQAVPRILHYTEHKKNPGPAIERIKRYARAMPYATFWQKLDRLWPF